MKAVTVGNGVLALIILIEIFILGLRVKKEKTFLEDLEFVKYYLLSQEQLGRTVKEFIKRQREKIIESTENDPGLKALFQGKHGGCFRAKMWIVAPMPICLP